MKIKIEYVLMVLGVLLIVFPMFTLKMQVTNYPWLDDFETGDLSNWDSFVVDEEQGCILTVQSSIVHDGSYALKCYATSEGQAYLHNSVPSSSILHTRLWFYLASYTSTFTQRALIQHGGGGVQAMLGLDANRHLRLEYYNGTSFNKVYSTTTCSLNQWYMLELETKVSTSGEFHVWLDDAELSEMAVVGVDNSAWDITWVRVGVLKAAQTTTETYVDDVVIHTDYIGTSTPSPPAQHTLTINTNLASEIQYTIDGNTATTGNAVTLNEGSHTITMPSTVTVQGENYVFSSWNDGSENPQKTITLSSDTILTASYELQSSPPPASKGYLEVHAFEGTTEVNATVQVDSTTTYTPVTLTLDPGTYSVTCIYNGKTQTQTATVIEGQTARLDFNFENVTSTTPPQQPLPTGEQQGFNLSLLQWIGISCLGAGVIIEIARRREE